MSTQDTGNGFDKQGKDAAGALPHPNRPQPYAVVEDLFAPEVFASFASSFSVNSGSVTIKFISLRWDNSTEPAVQKAVVVARITMPLQGAQTLASGMHAFLSQHGLLPQPTTRPKSRASDILAAGPPQQA